MVFIHPPCGVQRLPDENSFRDIYKKLYEQTSSKFLRFQGVGTDGGVDSSGSRQMLFWVRTALATQLLSATALTPNSGLYKDIILSFECLAACCDFSPVVTDWDNAG